MFPAAGSVEMPFLRPCSLSSYRATSRGLLRYKPLYYLRPTRVPSYFPPRPLRPLERRPVRCGILPQYEPSIYKTHKAGWVLSPFAMFTNSAQIPICRNHPSASPIRPPLVESLLVHNSKLSCMPCSTLPTPAGPFAPASSTFDPRPSTLDLRFNSPQDKAQKLRDSSVPHHQALDCRRKGQPFVQQGQGA